MSRHQICHAHCPGGGNGGAAALAALLVLVLIAAASARAVVHAAEQLLEVALIAAGSLLGLTAIGAVAYVAVRARSTRASRVTPVSFRPPVALGGSQAISAPRLRGIEARRPGLADLEDLAAEHGYDIIRQDRQD